MTNEPQIVGSLRRVRKPANVADDVAAAVDEVPAHQLPRKGLQCFSARDFRQGAGVVQGTLDHLVAAEGSSGRTRGGRQVQCLLLAVPVKRRGDEMESLGREQSFRHPDYVLMGLGWRKSEAVPVEERTAVNVHPAVVS